jgi:hypothetical protein
VSTDEPEAGASAAKARRAKAKRRRNKSAPETGDGKRADKPADKPKRRKRRTKAAKREDRRPPFARGYPRHPDLDALLVAFEAGNFAQVREGLAALQGNEPDDTLASAARDLRRRIEPSPTSVFVWALGVALLALLYGFYLSHAH